MAMGMGIGPDEPPHPWTFVARESLDRAVEALEAGYRHPAIPGYYFVLQAGELALQDPVGRRWQYSMARLPVSQWISLNDESGRPQPVMVFRTPYGQLHVRWMA
jgi:hypothetical protein